MWTLIIEINGKEMVEFGFNNYNDLESFQETAAETIIASDWRFIVNKEGQEVN